MSTTTVTISNSFKMAEKCLLPEDWDVVTLEDVCAKAINGGTPSTEVEKYWEGDIPWITGADILNQKVSKIRRYITEEAVKNSSTNVIPKGNLLVVTRTGVGKLAIAPFDVAVSQDFTGIIPNEKIKTEFLFWLLNNSANYFLDLTQGTSINGITRKDLMRFVFPIPPLHEQHRIAAILSTIDSAIEQTEAIIAKQQRIKTGLMQDLLTRGIDEHGNIRSEETHEFKDSPLGRIPVEWEVVSLGIATARAVQTGPFGSQLHAEDYKTEGVPIITVEHLCNTEIIHKNLPLVGNVDYIRLQKYIMKEGDIVFSRVGAIDRCSYVSDKEDGWLFSGRCLRVRCGKNFNARFLSYQLNYDKARIWILNNSVGSTMSCLNTKILSSVPVAIPDIQEQQKIAAAIDSSKEIISNEKNKLGKLIRIKTALMQDLLTGKVRVTELLNQKENGGTV